MQQSGAARSDLVNASTFIGERPPTLRVGDPAVETTTGHLRD
jgi:hypothetical protein